MKDVDTGAETSKDKNKLIGGVLLAVAVVGIAGVLLSSRSVNETAEGPSVATNNIDTSEFASTEIPSFFATQFPNADFSKVNVDTSEILSGGPPRDGIPSIQNPEFDEYSDSSISDDVQAIVYTEGDRARVYPYNILNWHEIVNDTVDGQPIAVTFCPLCGSALVFDRTTSAGVTEFGVSGGLRESNMIMFDRNTETFWQQATGVAIIGELAGEELDLLPFQLLTVGEAKEKYPDGLIQSTDTGHSRDYVRNPYGDYNENDTFIFQPSSLDEEYPVKQIFAAVRYNGESIAMPWLDLDDQVYEFTTAGGANLTIDKADGELNVTNEDGERIPHYFEMWFSWAVQHEDDPNSEVFDPTRTQAGESANG